MKVIIAVKTKKVIYWIIEDLGIMSKVSKNREYILGSFEFSLLLKSYIADMEKLGFWLVVEIEELECRYI